MSAATASKGGERSGGAFFIGVTVFFGLLFSWGAVWWLVKGDHDGFMGCAVMASFEFALGAVLASGGGFRSGP